jgi:hypothetical protein
MAFNYSNANALCQEIILEGLNSTYFERPVLIDFMMGKAGGETPLGNPGTAVVLGGAANTWSQPMKDSYAGGRWFDVEVLASGCGGTKVMAGNADTNPEVTTRQDAVVGTARFYWSQVKTPILLDKQTLDRAKGKYEALPVITTATNIALEEHIDYITDNLWDGDPASDSPTHGFYSTINGVLNAFATTANGYGNVTNRDTTSFVGNTYATAVAASLDLVDDANLTQGAALVYRGVDLGLTTPAIYRKLKQEALTNNGTIINMGTQPAKGLAGYRGECIKYGNTLITLDPKATTSYLAFFALDTWQVIIHPSYNMTVAKFKENDLPGQANTLYSYITTQMTVFCTKPKANVLYSSVS